MRKNKEPHRLSVHFDPSAMEPSISAFHCSCAAGQGLCQHVISLLYMLSHYLQHFPLISYSQHFGRDVYSVGLVINPSVPHLACSPDRRVYDATEEDPWGLLEIKSSMTDNLSELNYLKFHEQNGKYSLKKSHAYHYQVMGCMGLTGSKWEDFYVSCK